MYLAQCFFLLIGIHFSAYAQLKIISWNIQNFGNQKQPHIPLMANLVHDADVILIQEVQIDNDGTEGVRLLEIQLEQGGNTWNSSISKPTNGKGTECYAYLWKSAVLTLDSAWLEVSLDSLIDREPYMARFKHKKKSILLANFHAVP